MKAKKMTIRMIAVALIIIALLLLTMVYVQVMEIPIWIEKHEGYSVMYYIRIGWIDDLCRLFA